MILSKILSMRSFGYFLRRRCFLNIQIVLVKVGACVLERKNLIASPFTSMQFHGCSLQIHVRHGSVQW